jgi:two-component system, OmpR family, response regulator VanR
MRVLLAEDHPGVAKSIAIGLRRHGAAVDVAPDGGQALYLARVHPYDVVVLDRDLPEVHGDEVCRALNSEQPDTKVLMLTASRSTDDIVQGLSLGADDYLLKPFRFAELVARVEALARRAGSARPAVLTSDTITLDPAKRTITRDGEPIDLARKEFGVLHALMAAGGDVVSTEDLLASVWDANVDPFSNIVRMTVMKLRRKLGEPNAIETVAGVGYRM